MAALEGGGPVAGAFTARVYAVVRQIPPGRVATYADVAGLAGSPRAARAVGAAMSHNADPQDVPCHRVVGADGSLHGYAFGGVNAKAVRLEREEVRLRGGKVDLERYRWDGVGLWPAASRQSS